MNNVEYRRELARGYDAARIPGTTNQDHYRAKRVASFKAKRLRSRYGPDIEPEDPFVRGYSRMYYLRVRNMSTCHYCGGGAGTTDHVIPLSKGGMHVWHNFVPSCKTCNVQKGDGIVPKQGGSIPRPDPVPEPG